MLRFDDVHDEMRRLGYRVYVLGDYNVNLFALRAPSTVPNSFDDRIGVTYRIGANWRMETFSCTTDPGLYYLKEPQRVDGTAILVPGQYRSMYEIGMHKGQYRAITQRDDRPVKVWRDRNRDGVLDRSGPVHDAYGINIHRASASWASPSVDRWSAGCTVVQDPRHFERLLWLVSQSTLRYGRYVTYTLLDWPHGF